MPKLRSPRPRIPLAIAFALTMGCDSGDAGAPAAPAPVPIQWPAPEPFQAEGAFAAAHPDAVERISGWATHLSGPVAERPPVGRRGAFGTGNGWVFGLIGLADPLNTLHSLVGPTYERHDRFFGDYAIRLSPVGAATPPDFDEEWAARSLSSPVVLTRGRLGSLELDTMDYAPASDDRLVRGCFIRMITVRQTGAGAAEPHEIRVIPTNQVTSPRPGRLVEITDSRVLRTTFLDADAASSDGELRLPLTDLGPGADQQAVLVHCTADRTTRSWIPELDPAALLDHTTEQFQSWESELVQLELPDPMVADFVDGMKLTLRAQTTHNGASCPMSQYTRTWARDNIGPTLAWLDLGAHDDVRAMLDYIYGAVLLGGDLSNSYDADLSLEDLPPPPDWDSMPTLSGRVAAETPSYMVWMYGAHYQHTGRLDRAAERFGFLRRSLLAQGFSAEHLLPFTGDETYRAAMNVSFGLGIEFGHADKSWSANSSLLWLGASQHFIRMATELGHDADVAAAQSRHAEVEAAALDRYQLPDGCLGSHIDRATGETWSAPFEDVALKATWAGWLDADEPLAREINACHFNRLRTAPGQLQTMMAEGSTALLIEADAMLTGMLPGYALSALTDAGHVEASAAMNVLGDTITSSGNLQEYNIITGGEHTGLTLIYDSEGVLGDYTTKFRPWEGGIDASAVLQYLLGYQPDVPERTIELRPHLPVGWPAMAFRGLRAADDRFDVEVEQSDGVQVRVISHAAERYDVHLRWDALPGSPIAIEVDGLTVAEQDLERFEHFDMQSARTSAVALEPGATVVFSL